MGADAGGRWGELNSTFFDMMKNSGANIYFYPLNLDNWRDNPTHWRAGVKFQTRTAEISQWCKQRGIKFIVSISGTQWNPPEGWDQMRGNIIFNVSGMQDYYLNMSEQMVRDLQPDVWHILDEPIWEGTQWNETTFFNGYRQFSIKVIQRLRAIKPDLKFLVTSIPFWDMHPIAANPIPGADYYLYAFYNMIDDGKPPPSYETGLQAYWNAKTSADFDNAKQIQWNRWLNDAGLQAMIDAGLQVIDFGGTARTDNINGNLIPNYLQYMQDYYDFCKTYNFHSIVLTLMPDTSSGLVENGVRFYCGGMLNGTGWVAGAPYTTTLNDLGQLWAKNMISNANCQSGETSIGQDGCSSGLCCCSGGMQKCSDGTLYGQCSSTSTGENLIINPDFSQSETGWDFHHYVSPQYIFVDTTQKHNGVASVRLDTTAYIDRSIWPSYRIAVIPGQHIVFKSWVKVGPNPVSSYGGARLGIDGWNATEGGQDNEAIPGHAVASDYLPWANVSAQWVQLTLNYTALPGDAAVEPWVQGYPHDADESVWLTDFEFYVYQAPKYCDHGNLIDNCSQCGCSSGTCQSDGSCQTSLVIKRYTANEYGIFDTTPAIYAGLCDMSQADTSTNVRNNITQVHQIRPSFKALLYRNMRSVETRFAEYTTFLNNGWLLRDTSGALIATDVPNSYLVDVGNPAYQTWMGNYINSAINDVGYDGVFADNSLFWGCDLFWSVSSTPINPRTNQPWADAECRQALIGLHKAIKNAIGSKILLCNGIYNGDRFYQHQSNYMEYLTSSPLDGIMIEGGWYPYADQGAMWMSEQQWLNAVNLLAFLQNNFLAEHTNRFSVSICQLRNLDGTQISFPAGCTEKQMATYCYTSTLLGIKNDQNYLGLFESSNWNVQYMQPLNNVFVGNPINDYYIIAGTHVYARDFSNGKVLVNPTTSSYTISLGGNYKNLDGSTVSSITMNAHSGEILLKV
jgi:hypothetical protein